MFSYKMIESVEMICLRRGCGFWINHFTVQNGVRKIFISQQQKKIPKIAKCQKNRVIDSFQYMQKHYMFFHQKHYLFDNMSQKILIFDKKTVKKISVT